MASPKSNFRVFFLALVCGSVTWLLTSSGLLAQDNFGVELREWRELLYTPRSREAAKKFLALDDTRASSPLSYMIRDEEKADVRRLYLRSFAKIADRRSLWVLTIFCVADPEDKVRDDAEKLIRNLSEKKKEEIVEMLVLATTAYDPVIAGRASNLLRDCPPDVAIPDLFDALYKKKPFNVIVVEVYSYLGRVIGTRVRKPKIKKLSTKNPDAQRALVALAGGVNFGYDQKKWKSWYSRRTRLVRAKIAREK